MDWSKEIVEEATINDLDEEAVKKSSRAFFKKNKVIKKSAQEILEKLSKIDLLNKSRYYYKR